MLEYTLETQMKSFRMYQGLSIFSVLLLLRAFFHTVNYTNLYDYLPVEPPSSCLTSFCVYGVICAEKNKHI